MLECVRLFLLKLFMRPILEIAAALDLQPNSLICYGEYMAKLQLGVLPKKEAKPTGKIVLVSAINPTRSGEGKTTVSIGLAQGLARIGQRVALAREPSLAPSLVSRQRYRWRPLSTRASDVSICISQEICTR